VSTFRAAQTGDDTTDEHGRLLTDNVYGTQAEDAARRDFTINALYFDPATEEVWDFVGGVADIRARRLKLIGPPATRFREDPVRMLRAVRLASKLGLSIEAKTAAPISKLAGLMQNVPPARLFDEMQKLLLSGHAVETVKSLRRHGLSHGLLPLLDVILEQPLGQRFIDLALANTDARVRDERGVSPGFLFATLLWHEVLATWNATKAGGAKPIPALFDAMDKVLERQAKQIAIPRRFEATIKEIWSLQPRFEQRAGQRPYRLLEHPRYRAAWDFLELRCKSGELEGDWRDSPTGGIVLPTPRTPSAKRCCDPTKRRGKNGAAAAARASTQRAATRMAAMQAARRPQREPDASARPRRRARSLSEGRRAAPRVLISDHYPRSYRRGQQPRRPGATNRGGV
jgi:poly(A) polymerase